MIKKIVGATCITSLIGLQCHSLYNYGIMYDTYKEYVQKGEIKTREEFLLFDKQVQNIGLFPFTLISSFCYGTNKIIIVTDKDFITDMVNIYDKFGKKEEINE